MGEIYKPLHLEGPATKRMKHLLQRLLSALVLMGVFTVTFAVTLYLLGV